jgi:hypothetical protein
MASSTPFPGSAARRTRWRIPPPNNTRACSRNHAVRFATVAQDFALRSEGEADANSSPSLYAVIGSSAEQEALLRAQIDIMQPAVLPSRIVFVPHWKYLDTAKTFRLHVPAGYGSQMFTHLPSRTVFIDNDRYQGPDWLGYWMAHELGHLATNSPKEEDAEKAARQLRRRLKEARRKRWLSSNVRRVVRPNLLGRPESLTS